MSNPKYQEVLLEISSRDTKILEQYLELENIDSMIGYYEIIFEENSKYSTNKRFVFYFLPHNTKATWEIEALMLALDIQDYTIETNYIEVKNYWEDYKNSFSPFLVSRNFYLIPIWHKNSISLKKEYVPVYIEPGIAFGTGLHPSTQLMLMWIDQYLKKDSIILDAGCGSGILSIAALKKQAKKIIAFDIDGNAIESTKKNLLYNYDNETIKKKITLFTGSWDMELLQKERFHVIFANMSLPIFLKYQKYIFLIPSEKLVVSGITSEQEKEMILIFNNHFSLMNQWEKNGWLLMEFKRHEK